jgi:hypothetical protein
MLVTTNREYLKTLAQQEDLNWDGNPELDVEYECAEEEDLDELAARLRDSEAIYVVKYFYD